MSSLQFDAVREDKAGPKWAKRWARSWPSYEAWFIARGGDNGPIRAECEAALREHMPELVPVWRRLVMLAGNGDRAARFLSTWCPPSYLGGCSLAAASNGDTVRLVRNYDLSPDLNEGLLLRTEWTGEPVMGMVEFLWGLSDGVNARGLSVALAYGGHSVVKQGFGITTILRYLLETCGTVEEAISVLRRVPSHMGYNLVLADAGGATASVEVIAGGGIKIMPKAIATNHQEVTPPERAEFTATYKRHAHLEMVLDTAPDPRRLRDQFQAEPLKQSNYAQGFGTLFTAEYDPARGAMELLWPGESWAQTLESFAEGTRVISYDAAAAAGEGAYDSSQAAEAARAWVGFADLDGCAAWSTADWVAFGQSFATRY